MLGRRTWVVLALLASACTESPSQVAGPIAESEHAITNPCGLLEFGAPCDPGDGADECDGVCWLDTSGAPACVALSRLGLAAHYLDGRLCGASSSSDCGDTGRTCDMGSCVDPNTGVEPVPVGTACRPSGGSNRCAGTCSIGGNCVSLS